MREVTAIDEWTRWAAVDFGTEPRTMLWRSFGTAARRSCDALTTADVLIFAGRVGAGLPRDVITDRVVRAAGGRRAGRDEALSCDGGVDPEDASMSVSRMALRETRWRGARKARSTPGWSVALVAAMEHAYADVRARGRSYVSDAQLVLGLLADRDNAACRMLARTGINRRQLIERLRRYRDVNRSGVAWTPLVRSLEAFGVLRGGDVAGRTVGLLGRQMARLGGHSHPLLAVVPQEISRQAVLLGEPWVLPAHLVLAVAELDRQLAAAGRELPPRLARTNTGGAALSRHGFRYDAAARAVAQRKAAAYLKATRGTTGAATATPGHAVAQAAAQARESWVEPFEPVPPQVARGIWPALRNADPVWGRQVVELLAAAKADAARRGHRDGGTTHLLAASLAPSDSPVAGWLDALGVNVDAVRDDLAGDLRAA